MDMIMTVNTMNTAKMFWTLLLFLFLLSRETVCEPPNSTCAGDEDVETLNGIVNTVTGTLQGVLGNSSIPMHQSMSTILNMVCNDQIVRQLIDGIEQTTGMCPDLVQLTNVTSLVLGPLTFKDLLEKFQGVGHFCECMPALLQVLAIEAMKSDILYSDPLAKFTQVVNLTVICMKTTSPPPVNFTQAVTLIGQKKETCRPVLNYTNIKILDMESFIMNDCKEYRPDNFSCAITHTKDEDLNSCLEQVDKQMTKVSDTSSSSDVKGCRRAACVREYMKECQQDGTDAYMLAVNFCSEKQEFQLLPCEDSAATSAPPLVLMLVTIVSVLHP